MSDAEFKRTFMVLGEDNNRKVDTRRTYKPNANGGLSDTEYRRDHHMDHRTCLKKNRTKAVKDAKGHKMSLTSVISMHYYHHGGEI